MMTGGVCASLDYEMDQMTEYVAEMAQRVVLPNSPVSPAFRKFVSGLLSSTRLPRTTILLGMNYLARRTNMLTHAGQAPANSKAGEGVVWRMLTISLLLGSKFLDDNTFQNRSWSEVSGIQVSELNTLEHEWLEAMDYCLYVNLDLSQDYNAWLDNWEVWRKTKNIERKATLDRLTSPPLSQIDTNVQRVRPYVSTYHGYKTAPLERPQSSFNVMYDQSQATWVPNNYPTPHLTPPSAPDSALNTPEYMSATGGGPRFDWTLFNPFPRNYPTHPPYIAAAYPTPSYHYGNHYAASIWEPECPSKQSYFMGHSGYGQQVVAG